MLDLDAYLERIGLRGRPGIAEVHRAHATSIPFENLDPHCGVPISLAIEDVERKLVAERRGGYCFEHNLLLGAALEALGAEVEHVLARVRIDVAPGTVRPRTHLMLRVRDGGATWHADVGFGLGGLLEPLPFGPGGEHEQAGWRFRVVDDGPEVVLQTVLDGGWLDLYGAVPEPAPFVDLETSNWFTCTNPRSPFVTGLMVCATADDGGRTLLSDRDGLALTEQWPDRESTTPVAAEAVPDLLARRFGLGGYEIGDGGRLRRA